MADVVLLSLHVNGLGGTTAYWTSCSPHETHAVRLMRVVEWTATKWSPARLEVLEWTEDNVTATRIKSLRTAIVEVVGQACFTLRHVGDESRKTSILLRFQACGYLCTVTEVRRSLVEHRCYKIQTPRYAMQCSCTFTVRCLRRLPP